METKFKTIMCDICKERPIKGTKKINGEWKGICSECEIKTQKEEQNERKTSG